MNKLESLISKQAIRLILLIVMALLFIIPLTMLISSPRVALQQSVAEAATLPQPALTTHAPQSPANNGDDDAIKANTTSANPLEDRLLVATVNGHALSVDDLQKANGIDSAMQRLFALENNANDDTLKRLINQELVWQAATAAGFAISTASLEETLHAILAQKGKSLSDLQSALAAAQVERTDFDRQFQRILVADSFASQESARQQMAPANYLKQLQANAHISFGPAAMQVEPLAVNAPEEPQTLPITTPTRTAPALPPTPLASLFPELELPVSQPNAEAAQAITETDPEEASPSAANVVTPTMDLSDVVAGTQPGQLSPDFTLPQLGFTTTRSLAQLQGKPTVLSFWVTWCPYCQKQTSVLVDAAAQYTSQGIQFIGVNVKEDAATVQFYVDSAKISYPILLDSDGVVAQQYGVNGFPITFFLDSSGRVITQHTGALTADDINSYISSMLAKPATK